MTPQQQAALDTVPATDWMRNPLGMADRIVRFTNHEPGSPGLDAAGSKFLDVELGPDGRVALVPTDRRGYPRQGHWESPVVETVFGFTELLPSWNLEAPPDTGALFYVRSRDARSGAWSPWLFVGHWGRTLGQLRKPVAFGPRPETVEPSGGAEPPLGPSGRILVDYLVLDRPGDAFQIRATLQSFADSGTITPRLRRVTAVYSGPATGLPRGEPAWTEPMPPTAFDDEAREPAPIDLPIPFRTQEAASIRLSYEICSPTCTNMAMRYAGVDLDVAQTALGVYDDHDDLFGNWNRAVAFAGQHGLVGELVRVRDWRQARAYLAAGQPLICSIRFEEGEFPSSVMKSTNGHLILIRGITEQGHAIVNDSASADRGDGVVYINHELARAWLGKGGVTYLIRRP